MSFTTRFAAALAASCVFAFTASAQAPAPAAPSTDPTSAALRQFYGGVKRNILRGAQKMSDADYAFKPTPEVRSFGALVAHIADGQYLLCAAIKNETSPIGKEIGVIEKSKTSKADVTAALSAAFDYCDPIFESAKDAQMGEKAELFGRQQNKAMPYTLVIAHLWEHYGNMVTYMRLKGIVPPSSEQSQPAPQPANKPPSE